MSRQTPEKQRESHVKWLEKLKQDPVRYAEHRKKQNIRRKLYPHHGPTKTQRKKYNSTSRTKAGDGYVAMSMGFTIDEVPKPLLEVWRQTLILKRTLKGIKNNDKSRKTD